MFEFKQDLWYASKESHGEAPIKYQFFKKIKNKKEQKNSNNSNNNNKKQNTDTDTLIQNFKKFESHELAIFTVVYNGKLYLDGGK